MRVFTPIAVAGAWLITALGPGAASHTIELDGEMVQGALIQGSTAPGTKLTIDGRAIRVSTNGDFLIGFGRDAPGKIRLRASFPDGSKHRRTLKVRQRKYKIQRIDGLSKRKVSPSKKDLKRIRAEGKLINAARARDTDRPFFRGGFVWPVRGRISGIYGSQRILNGKPRRPHLGVDIAAPKGTPIVAAADGIVRIAHGGMFFTGKTVAIDHGHGLISIYAHMSKVTVENGQRVKKNDRIGEVGATGRATGPHLHWGVSLFRTRLDPKLLVGPMKRVKPRR